jgi:acetyl esterase/lipase
VSRRALISPCGQSVRFAELLRSNGTEVALETYAGVGHAFIYMRGRHSEQVERAYRRVIGFLRPRLGIPAD